MAASENDLKVYLSGGAANTDPNAALGGAISTTEMPLAMFDDVSASEATAGDVEHRGGYVMNTHPTLTLTTVTVWIDQDTSSGTTALALALADEAKNVTIETIANEGTAPVGPVFSSPLSMGAGIVLGTLAPGEWRGFWMRWTVNAGTSPTTDAAQIRVGAETPP
jgi:hypothetical protein